MRGLKIFIRKISQVFYLFFPIFFTYFISITLKTEDIQDHKSEVCKSATFFLEEICHITNYLQENMIETSVLDYVNILGFKVGIVVFVVGLWKSDYLEKLLKMGIV